MNRTHIMQLVWLLCGTAAAQNLISNPGFENANPGDYWQLWKDSSATDAQATLTFPDSGAHEGARYARVEVKAIAQENWHIQLQVPPDWVADSGTTYELKFWARSDSSTSIHVAIQDGPDNGYAYRSGMDVSLSPDWSEQTLVYTSDRQGNGALRFNLYLGKYQDTYGFDSFSLVEQAVGTRARAGISGQALRVRREPGSFILSLGGDAPEGWKAELFDLRGSVIAAATGGREGGALILAQPKESGAYFIRAATPTRSWVRMVSIGSTGQTR